MSPPKRLFALLPVALVAPVLAYGVAAGIGSTVAVNPGWQEPAAGIELWVEDNGVHTSIVMPRRAAGIDWTGDFPAGDLGDPRHSRWAHVAVSWGERGFFVGTPTWWDLRPLTVLRAMAGGEATVLHVEHIAPPVAGAGVRRLVVRPEEYRRLAAHVRAQRGVGTAVRGYAGYDAFYPANGRYDVVRTCNWWTGRALAVAGVRTGRWTPTAAGVMRWR